MGLQLCLGALENTVELCGQHDVTPSFEFASHESLLSIYLATGEIHQSIVGEDDRNVGFRLRLAFKHGPGLFEVDGPRYCLSGIVGHLKLKDTVGLLYLRLLL